MVHKGNLEKGKKSMEGTEHLPFSQGRRGPGSQGLQSQASVLGDWSTKGPEVLYFLQGKGYRLPWEPCFCISLTWMNVYKLPRQRFGINH